MARFKLTLEYAGTRYSGWQVQADARTVQGELGRAATAVSGCRDFELYGAGRTDAGVHALGQVAHLDLDTSLAPAALLAALNDELPPDINVLACERVSRRFHARHDAVARSYLYQVARRRTAFAKPYVWWVREPLDRQRMQAVAALFAGRHDFRAFAHSDGGGGSTRVQLEAVQLEEHGELLLVRLLGSHFLWRMVRRVVGVLVEAGRGALPPEQVAEWLRLPPGESGRGETGPARLTAPPSGLFLEHVFYPGEPLARPLRPALELAPAPPPAAIEPGPRPASAGAGPGTARGPRRAWRRPVR